MKTQVVPWKEGEIGERGLSCRVSVTVMGVCRYDPYPLSSSGFAEVHSNGNVGSCMFRWFIFPGGLFRG